MTKPGSNGNITAKNVFSLNPSLVTLPHKVLHVKNDDVNALEDKIPVREEIGLSQSLNPLAQELKNKYHLNNGQILVNFHDNQENEKKLALYRFDDTNKIPGDLLKQTLGKR